MSARRILVPAEMTGRELARRRVALGLLTALPLTFYATSAHHSNHAVNERHIGEQVRDDHDREAFGAPARDVLPKAHIAAVVKPLIGLIQQQHPRVPEQCQREVQLLAGAAGQPPRWGWIAHREPELTQQPPAFANAIRAGQAERRRDQQSR